MSDSIPPNSSRSPASEAATQPPSPAQGDPDRTMDSPLDRTMDSPSRTSPGPASAPVQRPPAAIGRYEIRKTLGAGAMGTVYLAHDPQLDRAVALKVPQFQGGPNPVLVERFLREAKAAATLTHNNICPVYDAGQVDGVPYMAMGFVEGKPLADFVKGGQQLPERAVAAVVRQLALAMQHAHEKGIIHRDLKPANIMMTPKNQPVVMDFGLARKAALSEDETRLTQMGSIMGTPAYMPPEQANGDLAAIGPASDVYSLGVILYELLAGRTPFRGPFAALMGQIALDPPPPISQFRPGVDRGLQAIALKALEKQPVGRFASMAAFATALGDWLKGATPVAIKHPPVTGPSSVGPPGEPSPGSVFADIADQMVRPREEPAAPLPGKRPRLVVWVAGGVVAIGLLALVIWLVVGRSPRPTGSDSPDKSIAKVNPPPIPLPPKGPENKGENHSSPITQPDAKTDVPEIHNTTKEPDTKGENPSNPNTQQDPKTGESADLNAKPMTPITKPLTVVLKDLNPGKVNVPLPPRQPAPEKDALAAADKTIRESIKPPGPRRDRAALLEWYARLMDAAKVQANNTIRFALLRTAGDVAAQVPAVPQALAAVDLLTRDFAVDPFEAKVKILTTVFHTLDKPLPDGKKLLPAEAQKVAQELADAAVELAAEASAAESFDQMAAALRLAVDSARRAQNLLQANHLQAELAEAELLAKEFQRVREAKPILDQNPVDPGANAIVGKYLCLRRGRWEEGLRLLALGSDEAWKDAARADLAGPTPAEDQARVGDIWWKLTEGLKGSARVAVLRRAARWYERAADGLIRLEDQPHQRGLRDRLKTIGAPPDLSRFRLIRDTIFDQPDRTPVGKGKVDVSERGYAAGRHFMIAKPATSWRWDDYGEVETPDFAVRVVGRTTGPRPAAGNDVKRWDGWFVMLSASEKLTLPLRIDSTGAFHIEPEQDNLLGVSPKLDPIKHKAIRPHGEFNTLLVICRGQQVDLFVNGERIREPLTLAQPLKPTIPWLGIRTGPDEGRVEFERFTLWSLTPADGKDK